MNNTHGKEQYMYPYKRMVVSVLYLKHIVAGQEITNPPSVGDILEYTSKKYKVLEVKKYDDEGWFQTIVEEIKDN